LRARDVSQFLSIGLSTVWLYASQGRLTAKKLSPRVTVFDMEEVERLGSSDTDNKKLADLQP
jgi:hypothetical protein